MRLLIALLLIAPLCLVGCASTGGIPLAGTSVDVGIAAALGKLADNKLMNILDQDVADTLAWVNGPAGPTDPLQKFQALQCPTAISLARADFKTKVGALQVLLNTPASDGAVMAPAKVEVILYLTKLRYGAHTKGPSPQAMAAQLKTDIAVRVTAVLDSCRSIFPLKQVDELAKIAEKAGLLVVPGGPAAEMALGALL